ncbi:MAG: c-type cytochrome [Zavarzinia sp.]|nr:c-type cytochrome [Zavarzinia sp.]
MSLSSILTRTAGIGGPLAAAVFTLALITSGPAWAEGETTPPVDMAAGEALATAKGCFHCHEVDKMTTAPSFKEIAKRFSGLRNAKLMLVPIVHAGTDRPGAYHWNSGKMPPEGARQPVSNEEAEMLIDYILNLQ